MLGLTAIMLAIGVTICIEKPAARSFALIVLVSGLAGRLVTIVSNKVVPIYAERPRQPTPSWRRRPSSPSWGSPWSWEMGGMRSSPRSAWRWPSATPAYETQKYRVHLLQPTEPAHLADPTIPKPKMILKGNYSAKERIMVPTTGNPRLLDFAMKECLTRQAELDVLFIRHLAVTPMGPTAPPTLAEDNDALSLFDRLRDQATDRRRAAPPPLRRGPRHPRGDPRHGRHPRRRPPPPRHHAPRAPSGRP